MALKDSADPWIDPASLGISPADPGIDPASESVMSIITKDTGPAREWAEAAYINRIAPPHELPEGQANLKVFRTFCFADLSGFTAYTRKNGPHAAVLQLERFRRIARVVAGWRGVRLVKWLGDGVMLVGFEVSTTVALGAHLVNAFTSSEIQVRVGIATGTALLFEGDDYIGEPVNLAAKLCAGAEPGEILAAGDLSDLPAWVVSEDDVSVRIKGLGAIGGIHRLSITL